MRLLHEHLQRLDKDSQPYCVSIQFETGGRLDEVDVFEHDEHSLDVALGKDGSEQYHQFINLRFVRQVTVILL